MRTTWILIPPFGGSNPPLPPQPRNRGKTRGGSSLVIDRALRQKVTHRRHRAPLSLRQPLAISDARRRPFSLNLRGRCNSAKLLALPGQSAFKLWIDQTVGTFPTPADCETCAPFMN